MNSHERRKQRRDKKFRGIESTVYIPRDNGVKPSRTPEEMNDDCVYMFQCKEPYCMNKFGRWRNCRRVLNNNPRTRLDDPYMHKSQYDS